MSSRFATTAGRRAPSLCLSILGRSLATPPTQSLLVNPVSSTQSMGVHHALSTQIPNQYARFFSDKTSPPPPPPPEEEKKAEEPAPEEAAAAAAAAAEGEEAPAQPEVNREEQLEAELKAAKDQLLRTLAEMENTRRIAKKDVQDAKNFAVKSFAKSLLEVADNLSRALEVVPEAMRKDKEGNATLATLYEGIEMTQAGLIKAFETNGLTKYGKAGDVFDPNKHSALYEYPDPEKEAGTVGQVIKVGYLLNNRVLRPAEVGVVKKE